MSERILTVTFNIFYIIWIFDSSKSWVYNSLAFKSNKYSKYIKKQILIWTVFEFINFFLPGKGLNYIGCYPGGSPIPSTSGSFSLDLLRCGLTSQMLTNYSSLISYKWFKSNNDYLIMLQTGMTIEKCIEICLTNGFTRMGVHSFDLIFL